MTTSRMLFVMAVGLSAAACTSYSSTTTTVPSSQAVVVTTGSEQACMDYGFVAGTVAYDRCVSREHEARLTGRVVATYSEAQLAEDSRSACYSYGLTPGTGPYDRCVGREVDARHYRAGTAAVYTPAPGSGYGYTAVTTYTTSYPAPPYVEPRNDAPAGVQAFSDEYGFRYDGQGNRLDRNGDIVSPHSTQP
jgi:hypothetical protein